MLFLLLKGEVREGLKSLMRRTCWRSGLVGSDEGEPCRLELSENFRWGENWNPDCSKVSVVGGALCGTPSKRSGVDLDARPERCGALSFFFLAKKRANEEELADEVGGTPAPALRGALGFAPRGEKRISSVG